MADALARHRALSADERELLMEASEHLQAAAAMRARSLRTAERVVANTGAAETALLQLAPEEMIRDALPGITDRVSAHLPPDDPRRRRFDSMLYNEAGPEGRGLDRKIIVAASRGATQVELVRLSRVHSFRTILLATDLFLLLAVGAITVVGAMDPGVIPLCFGAGRQRVCPLGRAPTAADVVVIEAVGSCGALLLATRSIRVMPLGLALPLLITKLACGMLTSVVGVVILVGEFVPGMGGLDAPLQIIVWAVIFGSASHLVTRTTDQQGQSLLQQEGLQETASVTVNSELVDLLDKRLAREGQVLSKRMGAVVSRTLEESLRGPELISFSGLIRVVWHQQQGGAVGAEGGTALAPDGRYVMTVVIRPGEPTVAGSEELSVAGVAGEIVTFRLVAESDGLCFAPGSQEVDVRTSGGTEHVDFAVRTRSTPGPIPVWVSVYQYTRLVHVLQAQVTVSAIPGED